MLDSNECLGEKVSRELDCGEEEESVKNLNARTK